TIIENKLKIRNSRSKSIASQVKACDTNSSSEIAKLTHAVNEQTSAVTTAMTAMLRQFQATPTPAPVKAAKETCVTCGAAAANYNQGNPGYHPQGVANQIRPPGFAQSNVQDNQNRFGPPQGYNRGNNFNQEPSYQATTQHNQNFHLNELERIKKINEVSMKAMQNQIDMVKNKLRNEMKTFIQTSLSNQTNEIRDMMVSFLRMNTASPSSSGTLLGNTVANPKSDLKNTPVSASKPNLQASIPYPSRRNDERNQEKAKDQIEKFYQLFKDMSFEISFTDALILMPKFASTLKALISNKEKLSKMARTPLNEHCSVVLLKKLPKKLGDLGKFLIPCDFLGMAEYLALADLGASINLMPYSMWKKLSLPDLTPTCMTLELADRSISRPVGVAEDVYVKTERALIDVFEGELTLRVGKEAITFNLDQTSRYSANYNDTTAKRIDVIDMACEEYSQEVLGFFDVTASGNPTPIVSTNCLTLTPFGDSDFLLFEEANAFLGLEDDPDSPELDPSYYDPEGDIQILEAILNSDPAPSLLNHEQSDLPTHLEYAFLECDNKLPVIIAKELGEEEKAALIKVLKSHKRAISWKLSDIQEVEKLLDTGLIYPISDSPWVSPVHCVPKKGGFTVVKNEENELVPTRLVTGGQVCIDYRKLNEATRKDHFSLSFIDQMLERLAGNEYYCFLDGFSGYF
nr:reverse transcriptase domain-containing protein [Tanacetum cinerariifolium]